MGKVGGEVGVSKGGESGRVRGRGSGRERSVEGSVNKRSILVGCMKIFQKNYPVGRCLIVFIIMGNDKRSKWGFNLLSSSKVSTWLK